MSATAAIVFDTGSADPLQGHRKPLQTAFLGAGGAQSRRNVSREDLWRASNAPAPLVFTATQIAGALNCSGRAIRLRLANIAPAGECTVRGGRAPGWKLAQLSSGLLGELHRAAASQGYSDVPALLAAPLARWQPRHVRVSARCEEKAVKLRRALSATLVRLNDLTDRGRLQKRTRAAASQIGLPLKGGRSSERRAAAAEELAKLMEEARQTPAP